MTAIVAVSLERIAEFLLPLLKRHLAADWIRIRNESYTLVYVIAEVIEQIQRPPLSGMKVGVLFRLFLSSWLLALSGLQRI